MKAFLRKLLFVFTKKDRTYGKFLILFSVLISAIETLGISVIMPFMTVASDFSKIKELDYISKVYYYFEFTSEVDFIFAFGVSLFAFYIIRGAINILFSHCLARFSFGTYYRINNRIFKNFLEMPYSVFTKKNKSYMTKSIVNESASLAQMLQGFLILISEVFVMIFIYSLLLYVNWKVTVGLTIFMALMAGIVMVLLSTRIKKEGERRALSQKRFYEVINRTFGNFKLLKVSSERSKVYSEFNQTSREYADVNIRNTTMQSIPRLFFESIGFSLIVMVITGAVYYTSSDISQFMGVLSIFVLGLYRLLPSVNRIVTGVNEILFNKKALDIVYEDLVESKEVLGDKTVFLNKTIKVKNLNFAYDAGPKLFNNINFEINKNDKVAFVGESGGGKSTLVDLLTGLLSPHSGGVFADDDFISLENVDQWRKKIGYIPQSVYLFDGTVAENVIFGRPYDEQKLISALKRANIYEDLKKLQGAETHVGDGGVLISGGQRQRIAIARVFYGEPEILILDEATSALDVYTESKIMDEIYEASEGKTLIIITHRVDTIQKCDYVYRIKNGNITLEDRVGLEQL